MAKKDEISEGDLDRSFKLGESSGLEIAASFLMETASGYFTRGSDDEAELLRRLSLDLQRKAKERHPGERT